MRQDKRKTRESAGKMDRTVYAALAGATLLMSAFAAAAVFTGSSLSPTHFAADKTAAPALSLKQADALAVAPSSKTASAAEIELRITAAAVHPTANKSAANGSVDIGKALKEAAASDAEARKSAKRTLAARLAKLKLTQTLLAARSSSTTPEPAVAMPAGERSPVVTVAGLHGVGTVGRAVADVAATAEPRVVAGLVSLPGNPGAILPPAPDLKPEPPRRSASPRIAERRSAAPENASPVLAYARPGDPKDDENGVFGGLGKLFGGPKGGLPGPRSKVAVYDISAATVHMPDGSKLEAHSGIGHRMDNPKYAHVRNLGPTPPNVYRLRMRERRFHGVEAIRMLPVDRAAMKGRDGMLTHTRLLRRSIGSHGCVAFKDYNKFLNAFKKGKVKTLIVVPSMEKLPTYVAMMERATGA